MSGLTDLIERYSIDLEVIKTDSTGVSTETVRGAIIGTPEAKQYGPGGFYTSSGLNCFIKGPPLGTNLRIRHDGKLYSAEEVRNYNRVAGFTKYILRENAAGGRV